MTRYEQIARLAVAETQLWFEERQRCQNAAIVIADRIKHFLQVPDKAICFCELSAGYETVDEAPIHSFVRVTCIDNTWYFGIRIRFEIAGERVFNDTVLKIGLQSKSSNELIISWGKTFTLRDLSERDFEPFLAYVMDTLIDDYSGGEREPKRIGFVYGE